MQFIIPIKTWDQVEDDASINKNLRCIKTFKTSGHPFCFGTQSDIEVNSQTGSPSPPFEKLLTATTITPANIPLDNASVIQNPCPILPGKKSRFWCFVIVISDGTTS